MNHRAATIQKNGEQNSLSIDCNKIWNFWDTFGPENGKIIQQ